MSYLPRMSKTYKEPQEQPVETEDLSSGYALKPASSLLNDKTRNPQTILKHYKYLPHAPPVLPGPSVLEEALENELYREASRMRRSMSKAEALSKSSVMVSEEQKKEPVQSVETEVESKTEVTEKVKKTASKKTVKGSKTSMGRKKSSKSVKRENTSAAINLCLVGTEIIKPLTAIPSQGKIRENSVFLSKSEKEALKREKSVLPITQEDISRMNQRLMEDTTNMVVEEEEDEFIVRPKSTKTRSVQCTIFGSQKKLFVIPSVINSLLRTQAFLFHELHKEEPLCNTTGEKKTLLTQIQLLLGDLCNQKHDKKYSFDTTYSDFKRLEKLVAELQKYMKDNYGDKGEYIDKMEDLRKVFIELKKKEMEVTLLNDKFQEREQNPLSEILLKESDLRNPEITLQNKRLEGEQLAAEVEFSNRELKNYQKILAELDWDIRNYQEQMTNLKKSVTSKSKTEVLGKKYSVHKFSSETLTKGNRSKENDGGGGGSSSRKKI